MMFAGRLDRRITIQALTEGAVNAHGVEAKTWATTATIWAEDVTNKRAGKAVYSTETANHTIDRVFLVRYNSAKTVTADHRVLYNGDVYRILNPPIEGDGRNDTLLIACQRWGTDS